MAGLPERLSEALADRYSLEEELGEGGMAMVYGARDLRRDRRVAIKVLKAEVARSVGPLRFLREIEVEGRLQHPNILPILDSGTAGDLPFYVMPYVEGETLRERLRREVQLPLADMLRIATELADALDYAHSRAVIHRDVKPENILLTGDHAFVVDFGVARAASTAGGEWHSASGTSVWRTDTGLAVGTLGYMSPEQATAQRQLDGRSDQYGLACVVYEMLAGNGERPYPGESLQVVVAKMLSVPVPSVRVVRETVPTVMDAAIQRALSKSPADRFRTCGEFVAALGRRRGFVDRCKDVMGTRAMRNAGVAGVAVAALALVLSRDGGTGDGTDADTAAYVLFPFEYETGVDPVPGETQRLYDAFSRWDGLTVVDRPRLEEALEEVGSPRQQASAAEVARSLGAGRYVRVLVSPLGADSLRVEGSLYDGSPRGPPLSSHSVRLSKDSARSDAAYDSLADHLLFRGPPPERVPSPATTRSLPAALAFQMGQRALEQWDLARADSGFTAAARVDDDYAQAHLWMAVVRAWSGMEPARWRIGAEQAALRRDRVDGRERGISDALLAHSRGDLATACQQWLVVRRSHPQAYDAWYGYAQCLRSDNIVVPDERSPSGWRFRSSYAEAVRAFRRAFELHPPILTGFRANAYRSLRSLLMTSTRSQVAGRSAGPDGALFHARTVWTGDTLSLLPYPLDLVRGPIGPWDAVAVRTAVQRQRAVFREIAVAWLTEFPRSAAAMQALGVALEVVGSPAAVDTFRQARALSTTRADSFNAAIAEVWMQVKLGVPLAPTRLRAARALADSVLRDAQPAASELRDLAGLASLTGHGYRAAALLDQSAARLGWLPPLLDAAPRLLIYASLGGPLDSIRIMERRIASRLAESTHARRDDLALEWLGRPAALAAPLVPLESVRRLRGMGDDLIDALAAWAAEDTSAVRRLLRAWRDTQGYPDRPSDAVYPEAWLFSALGDHVGAIGWLDLTFSTLSHAQPGTFDDPARPGALVNAMALRASLAARTGDSDAARRWAESVIILWSDADDYLQSLVARMRILAN